MILGLVGFIGAGKGTVGELLKLQGYKQASFAGVLKDTASIMFGWDRELLEGDTVESRVFRETKDEFWSKKFGYEFSPRLALQLLGTEAGRDVFHKDLWIYALEKRISNKRNVIITDTRFPNEIDWVRSKGGVIVQVKRGDDPVWYQEAIKCNEVGLNIMPNYNVHYSEWAWLGQKIDHVISNDGTLKDLATSVNDLVNLFDNKE
jgi:hypothetical protein